MFKLFKKNNEGQVVINKPMALKSTNEIIEEIHETFYSEVDRLLADAKILRSTETTKQDLIDKCKKLEELGFAQTKECVEAKSELDRIAKINIENSQRDHLCSAIEYFSVKYPNYKFITEDSVKKICAKYNLVYGEVSKYTGTVPDKNLKHIIDFKIDEEDECAIDEEFYLRSFGSQSVKKIYMSGKKLNDDKKRQEKERDDDYIAYYRAMMIRSMNTRNVKQICPLEIAAPLKDFNMTASEVKDFKISKLEIPDPVVLKPVFFEGRKHYLIVTAWGLEASDELVVNQKMN